MKTIKTLLAALALLTLGACSPQLTHFTERLYDQNRFTEVDLKKIQFYLSDDIVMRREFSSSDARIEGGSIRMIGGRRIEEVVIPRGTPGIFLFMPKQNRFAVSFEGRGDDRFLMFGPSPKANGRFVLLASDWDRRQGTVTYEGRRFEVDASSAWAGLMVDLKRMNRTDVRSRRAEGRRVNN